MSPLLSARSILTLVSLALVAVGCTAGVATTPVSAGFEDNPPADPLQDGLARTPQSTDPAPIVRGITVPSAAAQTGQGNGQGNTPSNKDGG